ncbi:MAG: LPS export ABC transporter periplasmic protein LptC [Spirochaetales bacterium]|nr:LPS export ABC transporter periplasmic protein LptC [Spirochaetales bacterium]
MKKRSFILILLSLLFFFSCSLNYEDAFMTDEISEDIPDAVLSDFTHIAVRAGTETFRILAGKGENYDKKKESHFYEVEFRELNAEGQVVTLGECDKALLYLDSDNIELWGNLSFYSAEEEATILAEYLFWDDGEGILTGEPDSWVVIRKDSGSSLQGTGFTAYLRENRVILEESVSGSWVEEEETGGEEKVE